LFEQVRREGVPQRVRCYATPDPGSPSRVRDHLRSDRPVLPAAGEQVLDRLHGCDVVRDRLARRLRVQRVPIAPALAAAHAHLQPIAIQVRLLPLRRRQRGRERRVPQHVQRKESQRSAQLSVVRHGCPALDKRQHIPAHRLGRDRVTRNRVCLTHHKTLDTICQKWHTKGMGDRKPLML
jgi:hypothetical protein